MNFGYSYNQMPNPAPMNYTSPYPAYAPSYSLPIQPVANPVGPMKVDSFESTRDKSFGDFAAGFFVGAGNAIYDMGHGLYFLGKMAGKAITSPIQSAKWLGGAAVHAVTHPVQTAEAVVTAPFKIAQGIVKPYSTAFQEGRYGEALGRLTVDVTVIAAAFGGGNKPPPSPSPTPTPPPPANSGTVVDNVGTVLDDVVKPVTPVAGGGAVNTVNNTVGDLKDILKEIGQVTGNNNNVNITIGDIVIGGQKGTTVSAISGGGSGLSNATGQVLNNVDDAAKVVSSGVDALDDAARFASTGAAVTPEASIVSRTVGQKIGAGIDFIVNAPGKVFHAIGNGFDKVGSALKNIGHVIANPLDALKGMNPVKTAEWIGNGLRSGADLAAKGLVYAATNPKHAAIVTMAVGRGGKAAEDVLMQFDLVR